MEEKEINKGRGGRRTNSGRKRRYRDYSISFCVSYEAKENFKRIPHKNEFFDLFLRQMTEQKYQEIYADITGNDIL